MKSILKYTLLSTILLVLTVPFFGQTDAQSTLSAACRNVDGQTNSVVRIGVAEGTVGGGDVFCRVIHDGNRFVLSAATIGNLGVIRRGVQGSVEVFAFAGGANAVQFFSNEVQLCLRGTGAFIFMSAANTPRIPSEMPAFTRVLEGDQKYTCAFISSSGTAVLVNGPEQPAFVPGENVPAAPAEVVEATDEAGNTIEVTATPAPVVITADGATPLTGCRVTTTALVRMRAEPTTDSEILARLPYQFSLQATARVPGWIQVIYQDGQGWVSDAYLTESAGCAD